MNYGLNQHQLNLLISILRKYPEIDQVILYGSRAQGNYRQGSDIDIALKGEFITHTILLKSMSDFDESNLPFVIDLTILDSIQNKDLKEHINRVGVIIYEKKLQKQ